MQYKNRIPRKQSEKLFKEAKKYFPGGVNSPVRAFKSVSGAPLFIKEGKGCFMTDEDDNKYIDFCCSWGPLILGHNNKKVRKAVQKTVAKGTSFGTPTALGNKLGKLLVDNNKFIEKVRFVSSGTEAVMSSLRLARGYTGKNKIIKFEGCYHGHVDSLLVKAGSGLVTFGTSSSAGVPESVVSDTIVLPLANEKAVKKAFEKYGDDIAAIIIEPIPANNGLLLQDKSYLKYLRKITKENNALLIFDEVISGFRAGFEGAAGHYGIQPDIITYGKIIGGGMPVGAYAASNEIMSHVAPEGPVYQAGTLSANPVAMSAGYATLQILLEEGFYKNLEDKTKAFVAMIQSHADKKGYSLHIQTIGSIFWLAFAKKRIKSADEIEAESMEHFKVLHHELLQSGVYLGPSGYEVGFVSAAHDMKTLKKAAKLINTALDVAFSKK